MFLNEALPSSQSENLCLLSMFWTFGLYIRAVTINTLKNVIDLKILTCYYFFNIN